MRCFVDSETHRFGLGSMAPKIVATGFAVDEAAPAVVLGGVELYAWALATPTVELVGHNIAYDLACVCAADPTLLGPTFAAYRAGRVRDTMVREWLRLNATERLPRSGFSLAETHARLTGRAARDKTDTWRLRYAELEGVPVEAWPEEARTYVLDDVSETRAVFRLQGDVGPDETRQTCALWWLHLCSVWGFTTDAERVERLGRNTARRVRRYRAWLTKKELIRPDRVLKTGKNKGQIKPGSRNVAAVRARVAVAYGGSPPTTEKGEIQTDDLTCRESGDPVLTGYGRLGKANAMLTKDLPLLRIGQIHTRFGFTANGRSSSSSPNIQNVSRRGGIRPCFVPRPGTVLLHADYGSLELCTLAQVCLDLFGRSRLAEDLNADRSPLLAFAAMMLRISYDEAATRRKAKDPIVENARQSAKVALYGFAGGLSPRALVGFALSKYNVRITEQAGAELKAEWFKYLPEMRDYFDHCDKASKSGRVTQLRSGRVRAKGSFTDTANTYFSGLGADLAKAAGFEISEACYVGPGPLYGRRIVNYVHDSFDVEGPPEGAEGAGEELSRLMVASAAPWIPSVKITAPFKIWDRWEED